MLPHPDTICSLSTLQYQTRLHDSARDRIAASAELPRRSGPTRSWSAGLAISWLSALACRVRGEKQQRMLPLQVSGPARPAHQMP